MKKFEQFMAEQTLQNKIYEVAALMVNKDVDPILFLREYYNTTAPELAGILNENWWDGVKNFAGQVASGFKAGAQSFGREVFGPQAKFTSASKTLSALIKQLQGDPQLKDWSGSQQGTTLLGQLNGIVNQLSQLSSAVPQNQTIPANNQWSQQPTAQTAPAQNPPINNPNNWPSNMRNGTQNP